MLVALVDDDRTTNILNTLLFEKEIPEVKIHTFSNGKEALESDLLLQFDRILLDMNMPIMGGMEFMKQLKSSGKAPLPKVIVVLPDISNHDFSAIQKEFPFVIGKINKPLNFSHIQLHFN